MEKVLITRHLIVDRGLQFAEQLFSSETAPIPSPTNDKQVKSYQQVFPGRFCSEIGVTASVCDAGSPVVSRNRRLMTTTTELKKVAFE
jgi:hypothetical protein